MKIVLDTNVLIEGIKDEYSYEKRIIDEVRKGTIQAFANRQTLAENRLLLRQLITSEEYWKQMDEYFRKVIPVVNKYTVDIVDDPEDNKILESAVESRSEYLVTNDRDLLVIRRFRGVEIVRPGTFWTEFTEEEGNGFWKEWTNHIKSQRG